MYVYLVVLMLNGGYSVKAPNVVFSDLKVCLKVKAMNSAKLRLENPTATAKFYATCIKIPKDIDA